jgi:uncharacterized protein YdeI (YjbR/CyaY-like superfamily)
MRFVKTDLVKKEIISTPKEILAAIDSVDFEREVATPSDLEHLFTKHRGAKEVFDQLAFSHKKEYVEWITGAKKEETRLARLEKTIEKLTSGKKNPSEK